MTTAQVVKTSVTANNNNPIRDYVHPDDQIQPTFEVTPGFKPFTVMVLLFCFQSNCFDEYCRMGLSSSFLFVAVEGTSFRILSPPENCCFIVARNLVT